MIGRKQKSKQADWKTVFENIADIVPKSRIERLEREAVEWLRRTTKGQKVAYAWSAGKDSQVIRHLCELAGINRSALCICNLEYKDFMDFVNEHKPEGLTIINQGLDLEWLAANQEKYLFPTETKHVDKYMTLIQRNGINNYYKENHLDQIIMGRRRADGNFAPERLYTTKSGITRNLPIYQWEHADVLAYIHYRNLPLPKIYEYEDGFKVGTGAWSKMKRNKDRPTLNDCYEYVYRYDKAAIEKAATYIESAKQFIRGKQ